MSQPWWEKYPERLEFELRELEQAGIPYEVDEARKAEGKLVVTLFHTLQGNESKLIATYPDEYPYFRLDVRAPDLALARHQNPYDKNLCLLGRSSVNWRPREDTLARFVLEQLPKAIESAQGGDDTLEERQGEPISEYYPYQSITVLVDSAWEIPAEATEGLINLGTEGKYSLRTAVLEVHDRQKNLLFEAAKEIKERYPTSLSARWVRIQSPIFQKDPKTFYEELCILHPHLRNHEWVYSEREDKHFEIIGVTFPEEVGYKTDGNGWVFLYVERIKGKNRGQVYWSLRFNYARAGRAGRQDMKERIPHTAHLTDKKIAIVGLGSIGAPSAFEFAKSGVGELRIMDDDHIEPGTTVRWLSGHRMIGMYKSDAVKAEVQINYPFTNVVAKRMRIGSPHAMSAEVLEGFFDGIDLIYDATAEPGVHHFLSDYAAERGIPYMLASATPGAWGGMVARFLPGKPCWSCFQRALTEGVIPNPPVDESEGVQPVGCAAPTFRGAHYDLLEVALTGIRLAVSTLAGEDGDITWDAATLSMREGDQLPNWSTHTVRRYDECICGGGRV